MAALTAPTPAPKSRTTGRTGGAHENETSEEAPDGHGPEPQSGKSYGQGPAGHRLSAGQQCNLLLLCQKVHLRVNAGLVTAYRKLCTRKRRRGCRGHQQKMSPPVLVTRTSPKGDGIHKPHHL